MDEDFRNSEEEETEDKYIIEMTTTLKDVINAYCKFKKMSYAEVIGTLEIIKLDLYNEAVQIQIDDMLDEEDFLPDDEE